MAIFIFAFLAMLVVPTLAAPVVYPVTSTERAQEDAEKYSPSSSEYRDSPNAVPGLMRDYSEYAHRAARGEASAHQPLSPGAGGRYPRHFDGVAAPLLEKMGEGRIVRLVRRKVTIPKVSSGGSKKSTVSSAKKGGQTKSASKGQKSSRGSSKGEKSSKTGSASKKSRSKSTSRGKGRSNKESHRSKSSQRSKSTSRKEGGRKSSSQSKSRGQRGVGGVKSAARNGGLNRAASKGVTSSQKLGSLTKGSPPKGSAPQKAPSTAMKLAQKVAAPIQKLAAAVVHPAQKPATPVSKAAPPVPKPVQKAASPVPKSTQKAAIPGRNMMAMAKNMMPSVRPTAPAAQPKQQSKSIFDRIREGFQNFGNKVKSGFQSVGDKIKSGFQNFGNTVKSGFQNFGNKVKDGFQTAGQKIKDGLQKAGTWIKDNGAKVAKFGLKVVSTATSVLGRVASLVPGVGKPIGKVLSGVSKATDFASDQIHANLGDKLNKGMEIMDDIQHPLSGAAGQVLDAVLKRDLSEEGLVWERDLPEGEENPSHAILEPFFAHSFVEQELFEHDGLPFDSHPMDQQEDVGAHHILMG